MLMLNRRSTDEWCFVNTEHKLKSLTELEVQIGKRIAEFNEKRQKPKEQPVVFTRSDTPERSDNFADSRQY
ncbi:hypothetical protein D3C85_1390890 [compost metagenome]